MDPRNGIPVLEKKSHREQCSWIPITPVKPEQMRRPLHVHYITTRPEGTYQREHPDSLVGQPFKDVAKWGNNVPFVQLLACTDAASAVVATQSESHTVSYCTPMHTQINGSNQQPSNSTALLLQMNQNLLPQMYQNGFLVPAQINSNLTCPQNNIDDVASNRTTSFQLAPGTPAQVRQIPNGIFAVPIDTSGKANNQEPLSIADEGRKQNEFYNDHAFVQRNDSKSVVSPNPTKESEGHPYCLYPPSAAFSTPPESNIFNKGDDDGIVSIKTPQPKPPRRKKHRPKVITEGKPERTPRLVTTNQLNNKENPSGKRKYVRKTGPKASVTASDDLAETTATSREAGPKSCRRSLNFNMESHVDDACTNMGQFQQDRLITEGKPERAPRPVTTKQSNNKENPSGKRKYVRKTGPKASVTASADLAETTAASREAGPKSCSCSLNFNVESHVDDACTNMGHFQQDRPITNEANATASIVSDKFSPTCQNKSQAQKSTGSDASSGSKSTLQLTPGLELVVEKSPIGFAFDLTKSLTRLLENYLSLPENSSLQSPDANSSTAITRVNTKTTMRKNKIETDGSDTMPLYINVEEADCINDSTAAVHNKHESRPLYGLQDIQSATKAIHNSNNQKHVLLAKAIQVRKRGKREYSHIDFSHPGPMNLMNCKLSYISSNNYCSDCHVPDIYKRKRTETVEIFRSTESSFIAQDTGAKRVTSSNANEAPTTHFKLQGMSRIEQKQQGHGKLAILNNRMAQNISEEPFSFVNTQEEGPNNEPRVIDGNGSPVLCQMRFKKKWHGSFQVCTLPTLALAAESEQNVSHGPQPCMEAEITKSHAINKRKKRKEKGSATRFLNSLSNFNANKVHQQDQNAAYDSNCQSSLKPRRIASLDSTTSFQEASAMSFSSLAVVPYKDPIEDIIQKFVCLNISGTSNPHMVEVLVPHGGDRTIVPYGPLEPIKKRRPRAKVDLDEETNRVWKLLMWKESSDRTEQADAEKEKWWEEERRIFRGRTDSFIARMHLVQGDRRFSQWKGSVVDSVVGVFLTQNVSDHLSSSAFMALAARFPLRSQSSSEGPHGQGTDTSTKEQAACILDSDENIKWGNREGQSSMTQHEADAIVKGITNFNESFENTMERSTVAAKHLVVSDCEKELCQESPDSGILTSATITDHASLTDVEDRHGLEDTVFSQISVISSENSPHSIIPITGQVGSSSESNIKEENMMTGVKCNDSDGFLSFTELLQMAGSKMFQELYTHENESCPFKEAFGSMPNQLECTAIEKRDCIKENGLNDSYQPINTLSSGYQQATQELIAVPENSYSDYQLHSSQGSSGSVILGFMDALGEEGRCSLPSNAYETTETNRIHCTEKIIGYEVENVTQTIVQENLLLSDQIATASDSCTYKSNNLVQISSESELGGLCDNLLGEMIGGLLDGDTSDTCSVLDIGQTVNFLQRPRGTDLESEIPEASGLRNLEEIAQTILNSTQKDCSNLPKHLGDALDAPAESLSLTGKYIPTERTELELNSNFPTEVSSLVGKYIPIDRTELELNSKDEACGSKILSTETSNNTSQVKKARGSTAKKKVIDWDSLRKQVCCNDPKKERNRDRMDSLDWEAIRCADVSEIADTIRERGMNNMLAERIKDFLNRIVRDHGSIDLEWLRDVPPDKAKEYLLSIRGLGLKSVECVRLLTLHHLAFPVDTNVGRICVRLGWVPLQPLPESLQLHLLEMYPVLESIQKYLWPRLCTLDQRTLYELHYQMITFGKVFCTKSRPNCNACPMRAECKHFASAFASARLALPGPEEKGIVSSTIPMNTEESPKVVINPLPLPPMERLPDPQVGSEMKRCEPIIEEPKTPEDECIEASEKEIEDAFWKEDPDEIPTIKLNIEEFTLNVQNYMQQNKMELQEVDMSKALVALTPEAASIPMPKLKNVSRLRTEHHVYELPDSHPLLAGLDRREPDDPCSYLLAIWTPGETAQSTQPPEIRCNSQESGNLCDNRTCFACNSVREAQAQTVRGTLLIPCRTAMRGSFPLNGTYFQVNEVFADHDSSLNPIDVPRAWIWNLPRRTVYFGTSIPTIFRGLTTEGIQHCFWRGFVCVRGFDQKRRAPRPLMARLHFPASKLVRARKASAKTE